MCSKLRKKGTLFTGYSPEWTIYWLLILPILNIVILAIKPRQGAQFHNYL